MLCEILYVVNLVLMSESIDALMCMKQKEAFDCKGLKDMI